MARVLLARVAVDLAEEAGLLLRRVLLRWDPTGDLRPGQPADLLGRDPGDPVHRLYLVAEARLARGLHRGDDRGAVPAVVRGVAAAVLLLRRADLAVLRGRGGLHA